MKRELSVKFLSYFSDQPLEDNWNNYLTTISFVLFSLAKGSIPQLAAFLEQTFALDQNTDEFSTLLLEFSLLCYYRMLKLSILAASPTDAALYALRFVSFLDKYFPTLFTKQQIQDEVFTLILELGPSFDKSKSSVLIEWFYSVFPSNKVVIM